MKKKQKNLKSDMWDSISERSIITFIVNNPDSLDEIAKYVHDIDFYEQSHRNIFESICALYIDKENINPISIFDHLEKRFSQDYVQRIKDYFMDAITSEFSSKDIAISACKVVREHSIRRQIIDISTSLFDYSKDLTVDLSTTIQNAQKKILEMDLDYSNKNLKHIKEVAQKIYEEICERADNLLVDDAGIPTGIKSLDSLIYGFKNGDFIVVGARPSVGKTTIALNIASNISLNGKSVGFFSLEMDTKKLVSRIISCRSSVNNFAIQNTPLEPQQIVNVQKVVKQLENEEFYIEDTPNMDLFSLMSQARILKKHYSINILFIDYIGLISLYSKGTARHEQISTISRTIKALARELQIPIIVLCQLNRDTEGREPNLYNLRDSGSIEQDADIVILMHREGDEVDIDGSYTIKVKVEKHRNGAKGKFELKFDANNVKFMEVN